MKVISFSLWGDAPRYGVGMLRNAELAARLYPSWTCRVHCGASAPAAVVAALERLPHVEIVRMADEEGWRGLCWRFLPAADPHVEVMLSRDADSRLGERERAAVEAWLASDRDVHVMRDHPLHWAPMLGGMWGVRGDRLRDMAALLAAHRPAPVFQADQRFLAEVVAPRVCGHWLEHDPYFAGRPFPTRRAGRSFVGQPFDEHDRPLVEGPTALGERWIRSRHLARAGLGAARRWLGAA